MAAVAAILGIGAIAAYGIGTYLYVKWLRRIDFMGYETKRRNPNYFPLREDLVISLLSIVWPIAWWIQSKSRH